MTPTKINFSPIALITFLDQIFIRKVKFIKILLLACALVISACAKDWKYQSPNGSKSWGDISAEYKFCKIGYNQSPINIDSALANNFSQNDLTLEYQDSVAEKISQKYYQKIAIYGKNFVLRGKKKYWLRHIEFHHPSEHQIDSAPHSLEMQIYHKSEDEQWLVISYFLEIDLKNIAPSTDLKFDSSPNSGPNSGPNSSTNSGADLKVKLGVKNFPNFKNLVDFVKSKEVEGKINLAEFVQKNDSSFFYEGSFTTPPCLEGVKWYIMKTPLYLSRDQLNTLIKSTIFVKSNARDLQKYTQPDSAF